MKKLLMLLACISLPAAAEPLPPTSRLQAAPCQRIATGPGPEDMSWQAGNPGRILISSHERRQFEKTGEIYAYRPDTGQMQKLARRGEPAGLAFRPHGIEVFRQANGDIWLYVVNHDHKPNSREHSLLVYRIEEAHLAFLRELKDPRLSSPNDVSIAPDGDLYISNDRLDGSSVMELALRRAKATVVHYREGQGFRVVADGLVFPNGIRAEADRVLVSLTFGNALLAYPRRPDGTLGPARRVVSLDNLDNIMPGPAAGHYLVSSHRSFTQFMRHKNDSGKRSASVVYDIDSNTNTATPFFADDGRQISAVSTALLQGDTLYLSQVFEPFILRCPLRPAGSAP